MTYLSYQSRNLLLIALETIRLLVLILTCFFQIISKEQFYRISSLYSDTNTKTHWEMADVGLLRYTWVTYGHNLADNQNNQKKKKKVIKKSRPSQQDWIYCWLNDIVMVFLIQFDSNLMDFWIHIYHKYSCLKLIQTF